MILKCSDADLRSALDTMILSASGWRKVFAPDGEHSTSPEPSAPDRLLAVGMGLVWGEWLKNRLGRSGAVVLAATDTRPTGPLLAGMMIKGLESAGCRVIYIGVAAAPEAMARSGTDNGIDAFAYISASHNPLGHNGVKFGTGGGVIGGADAADLIDRYRELITAGGAADRLGRIAEDAGAAEPAAPISDVVEKHLTLTAYENFLNLIAGGPGGEESRRETLSALREALEAEPIGIVADLNGSARCLSADRPYLENLGAGLVTFNDRAGEIAHTILPEGDALEPCRQALEKAHAEDPSALIGYVPDNDGDRGNLVIWDEGISGARILEAQEVFALSTLAEFTSAPRDSSKGEQKTALVINGPTSHRVRFIAETYGAEVHEAEVGEANAVNRAAELRSEGYQVRLLGEGSNGGTIIHPAEVRDPLNTVTALIKLLRLPGSFKNWCRRIGKPELYRQDFGPADILATIPAFTTTPSSADRAVMKITSSDQAALKAAWEKIFQAQWAARAGELREKYGFESWIEVNNEGTSSRIGVGPKRRSGTQSGGLKIVFRDKEGEDAGFIWMRGSGTEPVFRVLAEICGNRPDAERELIKWQREMVTEADRQVTSAE